tara:strand:- start:252 stop:902 length:651 start_codon:yes stop_codon:yes gene_type:complete
MERIVESIRILSKLSKDIEFRMQWIVDFKYNKKSLETFSDKELNLFNSLFYMSLIDGVSYLDEYQKVFGKKTETIFNDRCIVAKAINKPFIRKINQWKDYRNLRNHLLAHNFRVGKNGNYIFNEVIDYNAPRNFNDLLLLSNLIQLSTQTVISEFELELNSHVDKVKRIKNNSLLLTKEDVSKLTLELIKESIKIKVIRNRNYTFKQNTDIDWNNL